MVKKIVPQEDEEQRALAEWLDLVVGVPGWFHVPNGGLRHKAVAAQLKALGVKDGVLDIFITKRSSHVKRIGRLGVAIEMKRQNASPSDTRKSQWNWINHLADEGWITYIAKGWDDARVFLESLGYSRRGF